MSTNINEALGKLEAWGKAFNENGAVDDVTKVTIREAFMTPDAPILFPKVLSNVLREAAEPEYVISSLFDTVRTDGKLVEFPAINSIQAALIPEGQEYPEQKLSFTKQVEGKVTKKGVKIAFTDEVVNDSQWDIVGLHVRAAGRAMARLKEQIAVDRFKAAGQTVFDNSDTGTVANTTGRNINGAFNETFSWDDLVTMAASMHVLHHAPTDLLMNHIAWPMFAKAHGVQGFGMLTQGGLSSEASAYSNTAPLGINVLLSRFVRVNTTLNPAATDIYLIDRNDIGANLVREDLSTEEFDDPTRDIRALKLRERYDLVVYGDGEGIAIAKDVAIAPSYEVEVTRSITSDLAATPIANT